MPGFRTVPPGTGRRAPRDTGTWGQPPDKGWRGWCIRSSGDGTAGCAGAAASANRIGFRESRKAIRRASHDRLRFPAVRFPDSEPQPPGSRPSRATRRWDKGVFVRRRVLAVGVFRRREEGPADRVNSAASANRIGSANRDSARITRPPSTTGGKMPGFRTAAARTRPTRAARRETREHPPGEECAGTAKPAGEGWGRRIGREPQAPVNRSHFGESRRVIRSGSSSRGRTPADKRLDSESPPPGIPTKRPRAVFTMDHSPGEGCARRVIRRAGGGASGLRGRRCTHEWACIRESRK